MSRVLYSLVTSMMIVIVPDPPLGPWTTEPILIVKVACTEQKNFYLVTP